MLFLRCQSQLVFFIFKSRMGGKKSSVHSKESCYVLWDEGCHVVKECAC